ncbi:hypothetical protein BGZ60DRAFT_437229 [Tricladium varicosporioides]|nr:hypothetical protein BGZ60DRAFT_437229 [Hymenoscyphus varicosporioides]
MAALLLLLEILFLPFPSKAFNSKSLFNFFACPRSSFLSSGLPVFYLFLEFGDQVVTRSLDLVEDFGTDVRRLDKSIGKSEEVLEDGEDVGVVAGRWESYRRWSVIIK